MADEANEQPPVITFTDQASLKLHEVINNHPNPVAGLRLQIPRAHRRGLPARALARRGGPEIGEDIVVEASDIRVFVETRNTRYLDGIEVDFEDKGPDQSGLEFTNPNPQWFDEREAQIPPCSRSRSIRRSLRMAE